MKLSPEIVPAEKRFKDEKISYSVGNRRIASVTKNGMIRGKVPGKTVITMSCGGFKEKITVRIKAYIPQPEPEVSAPTQQQYTSPPAYAPGSGGSSRPGHSTNKKTDDQGMGIDKDYQ